MILFYSILFYFFFFFSHSVRSISFSDRVVHIIPLILYYSVGLLFITSIMTDWLRKCTRTVSEWWSGMEHGQEWYPVQSH